MSKVSFRARALDSNRPLQVHFDDEIPDLTDYASISRSVPVLPTGMEKEEETEHHLQEALFAQQQFLSTDLHTIPIPEIDENANKFKSLYQSIPGDGVYKPPRHYIRVQAFALDANENEVPEYDLDSEDEDWLSASKLKLSQTELERMLDQLERHSDHTVVSLHEAKPLLKVEDGTATEVYDYWLSKRLKHGTKLKYYIKSDRGRDIPANNDPYVAFRRRTEKMQTRKHRKNDEASYEKMLKLKRDMERACSLIELLVKREEAKRAMLDADQSIYFTRYDSSDFDCAHFRAATAAVNRKRQQLIVQQQKQQQQVQWQQQQQQLQKHLQQRQRQQQQQLLHGKKSRKVNQNAAAAAAAAMQHDSEAVEQQIQQSPTAAAAAVSVMSKFAWRRRRAGAVYAPARDEFSLTDHQQQQQSSQSTNYSLAHVPWISHSRRTQFTGLLRLRCGRGGRILLDRLPPACQLNGNSSTTEYEALPTAHSMHYQQQQAPLFQLQSLTRSASCSSELSTSSSSTCTP